MMNPLLKSSGRAAALVLALLPFALSIQNVLQAEGRVVDKQQFDVVISSALFGIGNTEIVGVRLS